MSEPRYALGLDYGTSSVRALIFDLRDGREIGTHVVAYPSGEDGVLVDDRDPNLARQHPGDYVFGLEHAVRGALSEASAEPEFSPDRLVGIGVDTTGSTPIPVDASGTPLGMRPEFRDELAAQAWLWKDHTSFAEAAEITERAASQGRPYLAKCGGTYSSEWFWSKILHCARTAPEVFAAADSWVELCDWVPAYLAGDTRPQALKRSVCAAGHKAMYAADWGGLPHEEFLASLDPRLADLRARLYSEALPSDQLAGELSAENAARLGLPVGLPIAVGAFDAHHGAVGAGVRAGVLVKIMGTSTCDIMVGPQEGTPDIPGVCGIVDGSVIPGMLGIEAGQSAVGDLFNWCASELAGGLSDPHQELTRQAEGLRPGESGLLALDWNNGNRTILVDPLLGGLLIGQTLHTTPAEIYRALIEATAFGALMIILRIEEFGVPVEQVVNCGGIAEKSPLTMQIYADVCNRPMKVSRSAQTCALGAGIFGALAAGHFKSVEEAQDRISGFKERVYTPIPENVSTYARLFELYRKLHDAFGVRGTSLDLSAVMKELIAIRNEVRA